MSAVVSADAYFKVICETYNRTLKAFEIAYTISIRAQERANDQQPIRFNSKYSQVKSQDPNLTSSTESLFAADTTPATTTTLKNNQRSTTSTPDIVFANSDAILPPPTSRKIQFLDEDSTAAQHAPIRGAVVDNEPKPLESIDIH